MTGLTGILELEDHGQDFTRWVLRKGVVVRCEPLQGWVWEGSRVLNRNLVPGDAVVVSPESRHLVTPPARAMPLNYPVESFEAKVPAVCRTCGCDDDSCWGCIERTGAPCYWVDVDLCSACAPELVE